MDGFEELIGRRSGAAVRRHDEIKMMTVAERKERAAEILATGVIGRLRAVAVAAGVLFRDPPPAPAKGRAARRYLRVVSSSDPRSRAKR